MCTPADAGSERVEKAGAPALLPTQGPVADSYAYACYKPLVSWQPRPIKLEDRERTEADRMLHR